MSSVIGGVSNPYTMRDDSMVRNLPVGNIFLRKCPRENMSLGARIELERQKQAVCCVQRPKKRRDLCSISLPQKLFRGYEQYANIFISLRAMISVKDKNLGSQIDLIRQMHLANRSANRLGKLAEARGFNFVYDEFLLPSSLLTSSLLPQELRTGCAQGYKFVICFEARVFAKTEEEYTTLLNRVGEHYEKALCELMCHKDLSLELSNLDTFVHFSKIILISTVRVGLCFYASQVWLKRQFSNCS
jgi:hypothetical protein